MMKTVLANGVSWLLSVVIMVAPVTGWTGDHQAGDMELLVRLQRARTDLVIGSERTETRIDRAGLFLFETFMPRFQAGLQAGYVRIVQYDSSLTAGMDPAGGYLGVAMRSDWPLTTWLAVEWQAAYAYHTLEDRVAGQTVELDWHEWQAGAGLAVTQGRWQWSAGAEAQWLDGDELASGDVTQTRTIREHVRAGAYAGLMLQVDDTGRIGIQVEQGARRSVSLVFSRTFPQFGSPDF